jgi:hypothetical protein
VTEGQWWLAVDLRRPLLVSEVIGGQSWLVVDKTRPLLAFEVMEGL